MKLFDKTKKHIAGSHRESAAGGIPPLKPAEENAAEELLEEVLLEEEILEAGRHLPPAHVESSLTLEDSEEQPKPRRRVRPEGVMAVIALLCALLLAVTVIFRTPVIAPPLIATIPIAVPTKRLSVK